MMKYLTKLFDENKSILKKTQPIIKKINALEPLMQQKTDEELFDQTEILRAKLKQGETLDDILPEAFATVREVSLRNTGLRHYDVQLIGGILLHWGKIAEMKTGEGKTLVATLAVYLNALEKKGVHVVTVNDYLARRDAVWVGQIYSRLGLSIGVINSDEVSYEYDTTFREEKDAERDAVGDHKIIYEFLRPTSRKEAYNKDITYGTNSEFGFDYLRDNITLNKDQLRQRELNYAIVDEIDSILIDEARVPLIISAPKQEGKDLYIRFAEIAKTLIPKKDYEIDEKTKSIMIHPSGIDKAEAALGIENLYSGENLHLIDHLELAVKAKALFRKEKEYLIRNGEILIIDEFTGRTQEGRRWSDGLHQAIEAKEGVEIQNESQTYASITYQNYFRMYKKLSGMTGTAETSKEEFFKVYKLDVVVVPTNKPVIRIDKADLVFATEIGKFKNIAKKIEELQKKGQPVLVGTASVEKSELLSDFLTKRGVKHSVLNAKKHEQEGQIIADAGKKGAITIATNMAGRGVDIRLGGSSATKEQSEEVKSLGGLYVIGTERHESRRIDNQLRGRSGRQGDVGETQFFISLDDDLLRVFGNQDFLKTVLKKKMELEGGEDSPIRSKMMSKTVESAQKKIEGAHFDARQHVLEYDDVLDIQRKLIYTKRKIILTSQNNEIQKVLDEDFEDDKEFLDLATQKKQELGDDEFYKFVKKKYLEIIDTIWVEHLNVMEHLKRSVMLQAYGQKDPLVEYKKEAKNRFGNFFERVKEEIKRNIKYLDTAFLIKTLQMQSEIEKQAKQALENSIHDEEQEEKKQKPIIAEKKVGRNELCPCGSSKKYKKCCGKNN